MQGKNENTLRDFLDDRDVPCPKCRYNLRGLTTSSCPECGEELRLAALREGTGVRTSRWVFRGVCAQLGLCILLLGLTGRAIGGNTDGQAGFAYLLPMGLAGVFALWGMVWIALAWPASPHRRVPRIILTLLLWFLVSVTALANILCVRAIITQEPW